MAKNRKSVRKGRAATRKNRNSSRKNTRRNRNNRRHRGGAAVAYNPAGLDYKLEPMSLKQGVEALELNKQFHGGAAAPLGGVAYGDAFAGKDGLPGDMLGAARVDKLETAMGEIKGMSDMQGGRRRRRASRKAGRKGKGKGNRKASRKGKGKGNCKTSRKGRKASRKSRRSSRSQRGGATSFADSAAEFSKDGDMSLGIDSRAAGLHQEWADVASTKGGDYLPPKTLETYRADMPN